MPQPGFLVKYRVQKQTLAGQRALLCREAVCKFTHEFIIVSIGYFVKSSSSFSCKPFWCMNRSKVALRAT